MRILLIGLILAYRRIAPAALRNRCIFAESCSSFVMRVARESGVRAAFAALRLRTRACRPGYHRLPPSPMYAGMRLPVRLADDSVVEMSSLSSRVRSELHVL